MRSPWQTSEWDKPHIVKQRIGSTHKASRIGRVVHSLTNADIIGGFIIFDGVKNIQHFKPFELHLLLKFWLVCL